jgi:cytochrome c biogenesis protein CcmG, thiol:disulfide interchange protein DsbE
VTGAPGPSDPAVPPQQRPRLIFLAVGIVLAAALGVGLFTSFGTTTQSVPAVGSVAPAFTLSVLGGSGMVGTPADGGGGGKPAVLVFFASWCTPCQAEIPAIAATFRHQSKKSRVQVIGVDGEDPVNQALRFVHSSGVTFPVVADSDYQVTEGLYYFRGDPDAVFINGNGVIAHIVRGPITSAELLTWEHRLTKGQ